MVLEPIAHLVVLVLFFSIIRQRQMAGVDIMMFLIVSILSFFLFRNIANRSMDAIRANAPLFAYRQVRPVDTVLVRAALEALLFAVVVIVVFGGMRAMGYALKPHDPLQVLYVLMLLAFSGLGFGLLFSAAGTLVPEIGRIGHMIIRPLYLLSAVIYPASIIPTPYRDFLMLNPLVHGIEAVRAGFFASYHQVPETDLAYLATFALLSVFFGLALQVRFQQHLIAR
jgi:capsular polysaccharide transport system permease protein